MDHLFVLFPKRLDRLFVQSAVFVTKLGTARRTIILHVGINRRIVWFPENNGSIHYGPTSSQARLENDVWTGKGDMGGSYL